MMKLFPVVFFAITASSLAAEKTFIDYFLPMPIQSSLVSNVWGAPGVFPRDPLNGLEDTTMKNWINRGLAYDPTTNCTRYTDGTINHWHKMERPGALIENGHVTHFTLAVLDTPKEQQPGNNGHGSKIIVIPFDGAALDRDLQNSSTVK